MSPEKQNMQIYDKGQLRKLALSKRNSSDEQYRTKAGVSIAEKILKLPEINKAETIMCYSSFRSEVPTGAIVSALEALGKKLCFPVCGKNGLMQAWHPHNKDCWRSGMMGICEPDVEKSELIDPAQIDIVICPMVAFDGERRRMGYGGGYYDRYLPKCKKALRIGVAFEMQRFEQLITEKYDCPMDIIVTEENIY